MIVVADTGPINYLIAIGYIELLPRLYVRILIPGSVYDETVEGCSTDAGAAMDRKAT